MGLGFLLVPVAVALGFLVRALANRYLPASQPPPRHLLTREDQHLSDARMQEHEKARNAAWEDISHLPPPGALGG